MKIKKFSVIKRLLSYSKPYLGYLVFALISAIISVSMTLFAPVLIGDAIDFIIGKNNVNFSKILHFVVTLAVVIIIGAFFQWIMTLCTNKIAYKTVRDIRISAFKKLNKVPLKYVDRHSYGDIISTV
ncbi:MAG: ABC transporter transmembrane domain-containing protein, partial [Oscillospiraceae bacterium]